MAHPKTSRLKRRQVPPIAVPTEPRHVFLACGLSAPEGILDLEVAVLDLTLQQLLTYRSWMATAASVATVLPNLHRVVCSNYDLEAGSCLCAAHFPEVHLQRMDLSVIEGQLSDGEWLRLPVAEFHWPPEAEGRIDCPMIGIAADSLIWTFYPKHCSDKLESSRLDRTLIEELIQELTVPSS